MTRRPLHIELAPGLPPDEATGQYLGRDRHGALYILRWVPEKACGGALGFRGDHPRLWPELALLREGEADRIVGHVEGPDIAPATTLEGGKAHG